jgi:hypothetical protein
MAINPFAATGSPSITVPSTKQLIVEMLSVQVDVTPPGTRLFGLRIPPSSASSTTSSAVYSDSPLAIRFLGARLANWEPDELVNATNPEPGAKSPKA